MGFQQYAFGCVVSIVQCALGAYAVGACSVRRKCMFVFFAYILFGGNIKSS